MKLRPVAIWSVPRSGSSWVGSIFDSAPTVCFRFQPLFSYALKGRVGAHSSPEEHRVFLADLARSTDPFVRFGLPLEPVADFHKEPPTHLVFKETRYLDIAGPMVRALPESRTIGLVRCPLAVLASWRKAPKEFDPEWDFAAEWRRASSKNSNHPENAYGFDAWRRTTTELVDLAAELPHRVRIIAYRDLIADPVVAFRDLFDWLGIEWSEQTELFIARTRSGDDGDPYGIHRAPRTADDGWRGDLPAFIEDTIRTELQHTALQRFLSPKTPGIP